MVMFRGVTSDIQNGTYQISPSMTTSEIIDIISVQHNLNIRSLNIASKNGVFTGELMLYIENAKSLNELIEQLHKIDNLEKIQRVGFDLL